MVAKKRIKTRRKATKRKKSTVKKQRSDAIGVTLARGRIVAIAKRSQIKP